MPSTAAAIAGFVRSKVALTSSKLAPGLAPIIDLETLENTSPFSLNCEVNS